MSGQLNTIRIVRLGGLTAYCMSLGAERETFMSATIINLIIQIIAGVVGGNAAGAASKDVSLGGVGNTIAGAIGGGVGGQWSRSGSACGLYYRRGDGATGEGVDCACVMIKKNA